jgi:Uma2 family endonuclease
MGMPATKRVWTVDEVRRLNEEVEARGMHWPRYELIDGELLFDVTPAPGGAHQDASFALARRLESYLEQVGVGRTYIAPADVEVAPGEVVQPDVLVVPMRPGRRVGEWKNIRELLLAVEVLSPRSGHRDKVIKRRLYQRAAVPEYWIVDLDSRVVERWRPSDERPEILDRALDWQPAGAPTPLVIDLAGFFGAVFGDDSQPPQPEPPPARA